MTKHRILHFDDELFITSALAQSLKLCGWDVTLVSDVDDLFRELKNKQYDAIIMDIMTPLPSANNPYITFTKQELDEMNHGLNTGVVLVKKIIKLPIYENIPILFLSARQNPIPNNPEFYHIRCDFLRKPELVTIVDEKLKQLLNI